MERQLLNEPVWDWTLCTPPSNDPTGHWKCCRENSQILNFGRDHYFANLPQSIQPNQKSDNFLPERIIVILSAGKELFSGENNQNFVVENIFKVKSDGETYFLGGSSCYLDAFQLGHYWGCLCSWGLDITTSYQSMLWKSNKEWVPKYFFNLLIGIRVQRYHKPRLIIQTDELMNS